MASRLPSQSEREKRSRLLALLDQGKVLIQVDTRKQGIDVPEAFANQPLVSFRLSHRFHLDTFEIGPLSVHASLSFDVGIHHCVFPWDSIFVMTAEVTGETVVFPSSAPAEYLELVETLQRAHAKMLSDRDSIDGHAPAAPFAQHESGMDAVPVSKMGDQQPSIDQRVHLTLHTEPQAETPESQEIREEEPEGKKKPHLTLVDP